MESGKFIKKINQALQQQQQSIQQHLQNLILLQQTASQANNANPLLGPPVRMDRREMALWHHQDR